METTVDTPVSSTSEEVPEESHQTGLSMTLKSWHPIGIWNFKTNNNEVNCSICKAPFVESCVKCTENGNTNDCPISVGQCTHTFHYHCISKVVESNGNCPIDNVAWSYQTQAKSVNKLIEPKGKL